MRHDVCSPREFKGVYVSVWLARGRLFVRWNFAPARTLDEAEQDQAEHERLPSLEPQAESSRSGASETLEAVGTQGSRCNRVTAPVSVNHIVSRLFPRPGSSIQARSARSARVSRPAHLAGCALCARLREGPRTGVSPKTKFAKCLRDIEGDPRQSALSCGLNSPNAPEIRRKTGELIKSKTVITYLLPHAFVPG